MRVAVGESGLFAVLVLHISNANLLPYVSIILVSIPAMCTSKDK